MKAEQIHYPDLNAPQAKRLVRAKFVGGSGGAKGGSGDSRVAQEDPDSLNSRQYAKLIEAISEGEIQGFANPDLPLTCVALEGTPVQNADESLNFRNFDFYFLPGTQDQSFLPGFDAASNVTAEGVKITTQIPWTKRFTNNAMDAVRIDIRFPRLQKQNTTNGDVTGTDVELQMWIKEAADQIGAEYVLVIDDLIRGKASNPYVRGYRIDLTGILAPWDIRVVRITDDHDETQAIQDDTFLESYSEIIYGKLRYPNTAVIGVSINAEQFRNIPSRAYQMMGLIIRVPLNYDPVTRTYDETDGHPGVTNGTWNGEWKMAWTNNPAWCYFDMCTHKRYGLGNYLSEDQINKFALYSIAQYCDAKDARPGGTTDDYGPDGKHGVPDGKGNFEPRFMCNLYLQKREDAMKVVSDMATIFRGMHYFASGVLNPVQDRPRDPDIQFGPTNVIGGVFTYSGTGVKARHTAALVSYNDQNNFSKLTPEPFEDADAMLLFGYNPLFITNIGCTSQMCARRAGKWALTAERILTDTIGFQTGAEGLKCRPGWIAKITDPLRAGADWSGRIAARTSASITLDMEVVLIDDDAPYWIYFTVYDLAEKRSKIIGLQATNASGTTNVITFAAIPGALPLPDVGTQWQIATASVEPELFRILAVTPKDEATVEIIALQYNESLFANIDDDAPLVEPGPGPLPNPNFVIPIKPKIFTDGIAVADSFIFGSAAERFEPSWVGHRITAPGISAAIIEEVDGAQSLTLSERSLITDPTTTYEFSAIGVRVVALIDLVQGVTRDLHIGWLESEDHWKRGYICAYRYENGNWVNRPESAATDTIIENVIPGIYQLSVIVVNTFGKRSTPVLLDVAVDLVNPLEGAIITGLEITDQGNVTDFTGRDVQIDWRVNSPTGADITPDDDGNQDPFFRSYVVTIYPAEIASGDNLVVSDVSVNKVRSATRDFIGYDIGRWLKVTSGAGFTPGWYQIIGRDGETAILDRAVGALSSTGGVWIEHWAQGDRDVIQDSVDNILHPTYTFNLQANAACIGGPYGIFKIGVKIRDRFDNESDEAYITVRKLPPLRLLEPCNLVPTINGVDAQWTNPPDISRKQINLYKNIAPIFDQGGRMANVAAGDATHLTISALTDVHPSFWAEAEDVFGLRSTLANDLSSVLFLGTVEIGGPNSVAPVTFMPDGGLAPADNVVHLAHPEATAQIWYRVNDAVTPITNNPADGSVLYDDSLGVSIASDGDTISAAAVVGGLWGQPSTQTFDKNTGTGAVMVAPSFDPPGGTYNEPAGEKAVTPNTAGADAIFYTATTDGSAPGMPSHDGALPPNPTGATVKLTPGDAIIVARGITKLRAIAQKAGVTDSSDSNASYNVIQSGGGLNP